jgi:hypothetical protein
MSSVTTSAVAIARVAYEAERVYSRALGERVQPEWEDASGQERSDAIAGVEAVLSGEARSGEHLHEAWARRAAAFPSLELFAPGYRELDLEQRRKILLFRAVVLALVDGPCNGFCHDDKCRNLDDHTCHLDTCMSKFGVPPGLLAAPPGPPGGEAGHGHAHAATKLYC